MKLNYPIALLALFVSAHAVQKPAQTVFISTTFATQEEAQRTLTDHGFFLFDIHGVLFENKGQYFKALKQVKNKKKFFKQGVKALFSKRSREEYRKLRKEGNKITERKFNAVQQYKHLHQELIDFSNTIFSPHEQMYTLVKKLKTNGYELYLLSNIGNITLDRLVQQHPSFFNLMNDTKNTINRTAHATGTFTWKPRLDGYTQALTTIEKHHVPHLALFVDDSLPNVKAAHKAGLNAIHFISYKQFERDLATLFKF